MVAALGAYIDVLHLSSTPVNLPVLSKVINIRWLRSQVGPRRNPVDVPFVILQRLEELGLEQQDLARAARMTVSYISQLLTRKKAPPAPSRTDIYGRIDKFLKLPSGELAKQADIPRKVELKRGFW